MSGKLAIVFCVHHKPWLMMGTLLTFLGQDQQDADLFFAYNVGDGESLRDSYGEYREIAAREGGNPQLSPFDERVREICRLRRDRIFELEYENDQALDSGTWYKFIRDGRWRDYEYVLFLGEGTLLAHPSVLSGLLAFAGRRRVHFVASGHEKRRLPRRLFEPDETRAHAATPMDWFHDRMSAEAFAVFLRDPEFRAVYDRWGSDFPAETEHHVPDVTMGRRLERRVRTRIQKQWSSPFTHPDVSATGRIIRRMPAAVDRWTSRLLMGLGAADAVPGRPAAYAGGSHDPRPITNADAVETECGVTFHRVDGPEWFGCATNHLVSRTWLERFSGKLERFGIYDVLDLPFAGTSLEVIWGLLPAWLGFEKWFTNGFHRVRKHFVTYQREDYPPEMASYINRYHRGRLVVGWQGDYLKLRAWRSDLGDLRLVLPEAYF